MTRLEKCIPFYIGCNTNQGKLVGVNQQGLIIQAEGGLLEYGTQSLGTSLFLHLQQLSDLTEVQSKELIKKGISIGRPNGYTFSTEGFFYLICLNVDLFGLIASGYARNFHDGAFENG